MTEDEKKVAIAVGWDMKIRGYRPGVIMIEDEVTKRWVVQHGGKISIAIEGPIYHLALSDKAGEYQEFDWTREEAWGKALIWLIDNGF